MKQCPGCLKQRDTDLAYCSACIKNVFKNNKNITPYLDFDKNKYISIRYQLSSHFSISGVQDKISLKIDNNRLVPTDTGGEYILKPVPVNHIPNFQSDVPANEHLTMQIAAQIFKINTARNALIRFKDGEPAYIVKRFDVDGKNKRPQEDFCQLIEISQESHGKNYKYSFSYEKGSEVIKRYCAAQKIEMEKYFFLILFNYYFANGDAHLKNFSLIRTEDKDYILSPAYDLLATSIHFPDESRMALDLFENYETESFKVNGFYKRDDFLHLAEIFKIKAFRAGKMLERFNESEKKINDMIEKSYLSDKAKEKYASLFADRIKAMKD